MLHKVPEVGSSDESDVETINSDYTDPGQPLSADEELAEAEDFSEDLSDDLEEGGGEQDGDNVLILCPYTLCGNCCSCGRVTELTIISTSDAKNVVESLIENTRVNLVCDPCTEELKRVRDGRAL